MGIERAPLQRAQISVSKQSPLRARVGGTALAIGLTNSSLRRGAPSPWWSNRATHQPRWSVPRRIGRNGAAVANHSHPIAREKRARAACVTREKGGGAGHRRCRIFWRYFSGASEETFWCCPMSYAAKPGSHLWSSRSMVGGGPSAVPWRRSNCPRSCRCHKAARSRVKSRAKLCGQRLRQVWKRSST